MVDSTLHMLTKMGSSSNAYTSNSSPQGGTHEVLDAPQLKPSLDLGKKLAEMLTPSFSNQHTPLD